VTSALEVSRINHEDIIMAIAFSPDGRYFATAGMDTTARVWRVTSGLEVSRINHEDIIMAIAFSPDGRYFATASEDSTAQVSEVATGRRVACLTHEDGVNNVAFSPDGEYLVTVSGSKVFPQSVNTSSTAIMWEIATGRKVMYITHDYGVNAFSFSSNGKYLAVASSDHTVGVWEKAIVRRDPSAWEWKVNASLAVAQMTHDYPIVAVTFSPDEQYLATASLDGTARVWEVISGGEIARMTHDQEINGIGFSPDGKYLATASDDHTARVWEIISAQEIARVIHNDKVNAVAFSPDGKLLATASGDLMSGGQDNNAHLWLWQPDDFLITKASSQANPLSLQS